MDIVLMRLAAMNYVSAVYGILAVIMLADWFLRGRKHYRGQKARHDAVADVIDGVNASPPVEKYEGAVKVG